MSRVRIVDFHQIPLLPLFPNSREHVRHSIDSAGTPKYDGKCRAGSRVPLRDIRVLRFLSSRTSPHCETESVFLPVVDSPLSTGNTTNQSRCLNYTHCESRDLKRKRVSSFVNSLCDPWHGRRHNRHHVCQVSSWHHRGRLALIPHLQRAGDRSVNQMVWSSPPQRCQPSAYHRRGTWDRTPFAY